MSLDERFLKAAEDVKNLQQTPTDDELLELYALYKQSTVGDVNTPSPGLKPSSLQSRILLEDATVWFSVARSDDGRVQRGLVAHLGRTVYVKEVKASSLLECGGQLRGSNILEDEGIKITRNTRSHSPIDTASHLLRLEL